MRVPWSTEFPRFPALGRTPMLVGAIALVGTCAWASRGSGTDATAWWCSACAVATLAIGSRMAWLFQRMDPSTVALELGAVAGLLSLAVLGISAPLPESLDELARWGGLAMGAAAATWAATWIVPNVSGYAYLVLLWILPGVLSATSQSAAEANELSRSGILSEDNSVRWIDLTPWVAVVVLVLSHRRGVHR